MENRDNENKEIRGLEILRQSQGIDEELYRLSKRSAEFHGHICPGLAVGIIASKIALRDARRAEDEELVTIVENDACGVDGIQALTGCTFGKGNLIFHDHGKSVFTFFNRTLGKALRLSLKPDVYKTEDRDRMKDLFEKMRNNTATPEDMDEFWKNHIRRTIEVLELGEEIFDVKEINMPPPEKARIFDSIICEKCKEPTMATRIVEQNGSKLCIPCSNESTDRS